MKPRVYKDGPRWCISLAPYIPAVQVSTWRHAMDLANGHARAIQAVKSHWRELAGRDASS